MTEFLWRPDIAKRQEDLTITPDSLIAANQTSDARRMSREWQRNRDLGKLWVVITCGDARVLIPAPERLVSLRSIDLGGEKKKEIISSKGSELLVAMAHFGKHTLGEVPEDCGGAMAKKESLDGKQIPIELLSTFVDKKIEHFDPLMQALLNAIRIARETRKPTMAVAENHRTGRLYPYALFGDGWYTISEKFDLETLFTEGYNKHEIYKDGIPFIPEDKIPDKYNEFLNAGRDHAEDMIRNYPDFSDMQETQNPRMIVISSKLSSVRTRYPELMDIPGSVFRLLLNRSKNPDTQEIEITEESVNDTVGQALYAISHAVENFGKEGAPFSGTDRLIIETSNIEHSTMIAERFAKEPIVQQWSQLHDRKIILLQNRGGFTNKGEYYNFQS